VKYSIQPPSSRTQWIIAVTASVLAGWVETTSPAPSSRQLHACGSACKHLYAVDTWF